MQIPMAVNNNQEQQICEGFKLASSRDPKFYVPIDLVKLVAEFALKPPKEYDDVFMEKYTIFISKHSWQDILKISKEYLIQLGCECTIKNFSIECTFYNEQRCVNMHFHVNIFTSSHSEDEYLFEFRRRRVFGTFCTVYSTRQRAWNGKSRENRRIRFSPTTSAV